MSKHRRTKSWSAMKGMQPTSDKPARSAVKTRKQPHGDGPSEAQETGQQAGLKWVSGRLEAQLVRDIDAHNGPWFIPCDSDGVVEGEHGSPNQPATARRPQEGHQPRSRPLRAA
jgi:hypothetical protein